MTPSCFYAFLPSPDISACICACVRVPMLLCCSCQKITVQCLFLLSSPSISSKVCVFVKTHLCSSLRPEAVWNCVDCVPVWPCSFFLACCKAAITVVAAVRCVNLFLLFVVISCWTLSALPTCFPGSPVASVCSALDFCWSTTLFPVKRHRSSAARSLPSLSYCYEASGISFCPSAVIV